MTGTTETELLTVTIDGTAVQVPKGTLVIRAAELIGVQIPRFCDHPLLAPVGACRQCLVEIEGQRKPAASCTIGVTDGMVVHTQETSPTADQAQHGVMELLLINHPLDCPICDKGGECPLQNQAMSNGAAESRFHDVKRTFPKPIPLTEQVLLDRERCILCARCTRFADQIAGDPFIEMLERGAQQQVGVGPHSDDGSYFSGNTIQICPVGALTSAAYRFRARPFDLVSSPSVCEHCASGCAQRTDHRRGKVLRRLAGDDPEVNEEWNCDKGRFAFTYATEPDRLTTPLVRGDGGELRPASWSEALAVAARGLAAANGNVGVLVGGRATVEDAYAYAKFSRIALQTNNIDFRARATSDEETHFLAAHVAGKPMTVTYADLESASTVLLVGFEPEEESPILYLRLRKAARTRGVRVVALAPFATSGLRKMSGTLIPTPPGDESHVMDRETLDLDAESYILVGERAGAIPGCLSAAARLAKRTGARLAWVPRRAGERGALEAGALGSLLPGGRPVSDGATRAEVAEAWNNADLPATPGLRVDEMLDASAELGAFLVGGVDPADLADPTAALAALDRASCVISLEIRRSAVTDRADVVFPVAMVQHKSGTFLNWEGRERPFDTALPEPGALSDLRVLDALAEEMGRPIHLPDTAAAHAERRTLGLWGGTRPTPPDVPPPTSPRPGPGEALRAGWRMLLDTGRLQDGEPRLAATAHAPIVRLSPATATEIGASPGDLVTVDDTVTLPLVITPDLPDRVAWLPLGTHKSTAHVVTIARAEGDA